MRIKFLVLILLVIVFSSCRSGKKLTNGSRSKVVLKQPKRDTKTVQVESPNKTIRGQPIVATPKNTEEYVKMFSSIAVQKMKSYRIPASITLAQGILESGSGRSDLAMRSNNHFGIKCHKGWEGESVTHDDDAIAECFRKYKHPKTSYEDHSKFLTGRKRYAGLFKLGATNYKGWAYGLKKAGYATDPRYPNKLIGLIKKYDLHKYDLQKGSKIKKTKPKKVYKSNLKKHSVGKGDTLYSISRKYNITVDQLKKKNRLTSNNLKIGQKLIVK